MNKVLLLLFLPLLISCSQKKDENVNKIIVDFDKLVNVKDFIDSSYYVKLQTTDSCYIGDIKKVVVDENNIYISESSERKLFMFDKNGNYIRTLSKRGKGHGEYIYLTDFDVFDSTIFIFDNASKNILIYDSEMNLINKFSPDADGLNIKVLNENELCLFADASAHNLHNFARIDYKKNKTICYFDKIPRNESYVFGNEHAFNETYNGDILITKHFDHTIYTLESDKITPLYKIDFKTKDKIPHNFESTPRNELSEKMRKKLIVHRINDVYFHDSLLYMVYIAPYSDGIGRTYISKVNLESNLVETGVIGNKEQLKDFPFFLEPIGIQKDGTAISVITYSTVNYIQENNNIEIFKEGEIKETDNPILFFHKLKP